LTVVSPYGTLVLLLGIDEERAPISGFQSLPENTYIEALQREMHSDSHSLKKVLIGDKRLLVFEDEFFKICNSLTGLKKKEEGRGWNGTIPS
jgi:hypothetical protein